MTRARKPGVHVGDVYWGPGWRRYVFAPGSAIFEQDCLRDIAAFIEARTSEQKTAGAARG